MRLRAVRAALLGAAFAAFVTLPGLGTGTLWDNSETAYGEVAREILLTHDWIVMHLNGAPWFVQPPLYFWLAAAFAHALGLGPLALRLPSALATIAMSGLLGYAVARRRGERAGTLAAIILATALMQAIVGRLAIMDALLDLAVLAALVAWLAALESHLERSPGERARAFALGALALGVGTLAKGPVAPVIVVLIVGTWALWERRSGVRLVAPTPGALALALGVYAAVVLPWFGALIARVGWGAAAELIGHYSVGRYTGVIENQRGPWWYYVPVLILGFFPWIAFLPVAASAALARARRGDSLARLALVWAALPIVFFSFAQTKLPNYIALAVPACALLVGLWFASAVRTRRAALVSAASLPVFVALVGVAIVLFTRTNALDVTPLLPQLRALGIGMLAGSLATVAALALPASDRVAPYALAATGAALILFVALVAEPAAEPLKPIPRIARLISAQRGAGSVVAIRTVGGTNGLAYYTTPGVVTIDDTDPSFVALICRSADVYVVTRAADARRLESLALRHGRRATDLGDVRNVTAVHVDGPGCAVASVR